MKNSVVELKGITKVFGTVKASDDVTVSFNYGEVHSLLGENGAGKSTLMNVLCGIYQPDSGEIIIRGERAAVRSPRDAIGHGIGMIHQHLKLVEDHTVLENMIAGQKGGFFIKKSKLEADIRELCDHYDIKVDPRTKIKDLSIAEKQRVEILKVLYRGAKILILDEPTAVLTPQETDNLFNIIRKMRADNCTILIITHKLDEVLEISDRITVLRKGKYIDTLINEGLEPRTLTDKMVGKSTNLEIVREAVSKGENVLEVSHLTVFNHEEAHALKDVTFTVAKGEILGVAGVAGSGQKELCESIAGLQKIEKGAILFNRENLVGKTPRKIIDMGISMSFVPEDRLGMGLVSSMDITDNVLLKEYNRQQGVFLSRKEAKEQALDLVDKLSIDTPSVDTEVRLLSGGNIQKVLLGREIETQPELIITAYPVRGLDVGSAHKVYDLINEQKKKGVGVIFVGEDLDVLRAFCDRIMVLCDGQVTGIVDASTVTRQDLGYMMAGRHMDEVMNNA
jgi:simple sugar transport system ATP-binding protein